MLKTCKIVITKCCQFNVVIGEPRMGETTALLAVLPFQIISLSRAMRPGLQIRHFWVAKSLFLTITFHEKMQDKTSCF